MGRLFWKFFLAFWLALLLAGSGVGLVMRWQAETAKERSELMAMGPRSLYLLDTAATRLKYGGLNALTELLHEHRGRRMSSLYVVDQADRVLFGRGADHAAIEQARTQAARDDEAALARYVLAPDGQTYLLFLSADSRALRGRPPRPEPLPAWVPVIIGLLSSIGFSALLAWYLTRPVRHLRQALAALAAGRMQTRVGALMGGRRDEIAELGHDFDRMAQQLQQLVNAQRRLLHDVSHELRSPLARLQAAVGLARQDPRKLESMLDRVERETMRLDELVGGLLTLSRLESGADEPSLQPVDLTELVAGIVADAGFEAYAVNRAVKFIASEEIRITGRLEQLHRAIENVIRNAVKFTAEGSIVEVSLMRVEPNEVKISVADRGPGVQEAELAAIFEPFCRVGDAGAPGFGLGLAIARRAIETQGGRIVASNRAGGGLLMEMILPMTLPMSA